MKHFLCNRRQVELTYSLLMDIKLSAMSATPRAVTMETHPLALTASFTVFEGVVRDEHMECIGRSLWCPILDS